MNIKRSQEEQHIPILDNPEYLNITYERAKIDPLMIVSFLRDIESCAFQFVYAKNNPNNWYICLKSETFNPPVFYFPTEEQDETLPYDHTFLKTLLDEMKPWCKGDLLNKTFIEIIINQIFVKKRFSENLTVNGTYLNEIENKKNEVIYIHGNEQYKKDILYVLFDLLSNEITKAQHLQKNQELIMGILQIMIDKKTDKLGLNRVVLKEGCIINGSFFNITAMSKELQLGEIDNGLIDAILTPEFINIFNDYLKVRDQSTALAHHGVISTQKKFEFDELMHNIYIAEQIILLLAATILMTMAALMGLNIMLVATGALIFLISCYELSSVPDVSREFDFNKNRCLKIHERFFEDNYCKTNDLTKKTFEEACNNIEHNVSIFRNNPG